MRPKGGFSEEDTSKINVFRIEIPCLEFQSQAPTFLPEKRWTVVVEAREIT